MGIFERILGIKEMICREAGMVDFMGQLNAYGMPTNPVTLYSWVCLCGCFLERTASNLLAEKRIYVLT